MSLKLKLKESLFHLLELLPEKQGFYAYHTIQNLANSQNMLDRPKTNTFSFRGLQRLLQENKLSLEGKNVLEIGSGWAPVMPYLMLYKGKAKSVSSFDLNRHFNRKRIRELNEVFLSEYGINVRAEPKSEWDLPKEIAYYPNTNLINIELPETDLIFSRFVLEHVKPEDLRLMHQKFKADLKPGSIIVHLISPSDHRAYVDKKLSLQDFLQYSEAQWRKKQTRFDYHNRLRLPQYKAIFKAAGLELLHIEYDQPGVDSFKRFKSLIIHTDFKKFTDKELTAGSINVVLRV